MYLIIQLNPYYFMIVKFEDFSTPLQPDLEMRLLLWMKYTPSLYKN